MCHLGRQPKIPNQPYPLQQPQHPPTRVPFAGEQAKPGRARKGVVIVMPGFAHGQQRGEQDVAPLHGGPVHLVVHLPLVVCKVADQPVPQHPCSDTGTDAPKHKAPAAPQEEQDGPRKLLSHPGAFQELVEAIGGHPLFDANDGRMRQLQLARQLPPGVAPESTSVPKVIVAIRHALCEIPQFVLPQQADGACQPDLHAEIDQQVFQPARAGITVMDQLAVASQRMPQQQHASRRRQEQDQRAPGEGHRTAHHGSGQHAEKPDGLPGRPLHDSLAHIDRVACGYTMMGEALRLRFHLVLLMLC